jgi:flagellar hook-associated protein 3 FlgL
VRVPTRTAHEAMQQTMRNNYAQLVDAQRKMATGKRLNKVSDGPADAASVNRLRNQVKMNSAQILAADDGMAMLAAQDNALQKVSEILGRVKELMVAASSDIESDNGRQAIATELSGLRDQLVSLANTTYDDRSVFGGFASRAVELSGSVVTWVGDSSAVDRRVAPELTVQVNTSAYDVFGFAAGVDNVFSMLGRTVANVQGGNTTGVREDLDVLELRHADITNSLGSIGGRYNQLELARDTAVSTSVELRENRSKLEDVDLGEAVVQLKNSESAYEATLAVIARMHTTSLLDFLR